MVASMQFLLSIVLTAFPVPLIFKFWMCVFVVCESLFILFLFFNLIGIYLFSNSGVWREILLFWSVFTCQDFTEQFYIVYYSNLNY